MYYTEQGKKAACLVHIFFFPFFFSLLSKQHVKGQQRQEKLKLKLQCLKENKVAMMSSSEEIKTTAQGTVTATTAGCSTDLVIINRAPQCQHNKQQQHSDQKFSAQTMPSSTNTNTDRQTLSTAFFCLTNGRCWCWCWNKASAPAHTLQQSCRPAWGVLVQFSLCSVSLLSTQKC